MAARFRSNPAAEREIRSQPLFQAQMRARAELVRTTAYAAAPRKSGYYRRHLEVVGTAVVSFDPFGHLVEWGSIHNPPYAPLRRGVLAAGLQLRESAI
jgi:hypothetical protein